MIRHPYYNPIPEDSRNFDIVPKSWPPVGARILINVRDGDDWQPLSSEPLITAVSNAVKTNKHIAERVDVLRKQMHVPAGYGCERQDSGPIEHIPLPGAPANVKPRSKWKKQPWRRRRWAQDGYK